MIAESVSAPVDRSPSLRPAPRRRGAKVLARLTKLLLLKGEQAEPLKDPAEIYWDDLTAANRLKIYLLSNGVDVPKEVVETLSKLTEQYNPATLDSLEASQAEGGLHLDWSDLAP